MANRVTQDIKYVITGDGAQKARVTQDVKYLIVTAGLSVYQSSPFSDSDTFPSGGEVTVGSGSITVTQSSTFSDSDTFPSGGLVSANPVLSQGSTYQDQDTFPAGGVVSAPMPPSTEPRGYLGRGIVAPRAVAPNQAMLDLEAEAELGRRFLSWYSGIKAGMSGLGDLGPNESLGYNQRRFDNAAPEKLAKMLHARGRLVTPATGSDYTLIDFTTPVGYLFRMQSLYCHYTGTGFVDGSGDIEWRVMIGSVFARNMAAIKYQLGTPGCWFPVSDYIVVQPGRRVRMLVRIYNVSGLIQIGSSYVLGGLQGYLTPNG